jgi:hypothetical protein|tara:strand:+ start:593 stop:1030 length:438 start_codon:yes stop_codon:yes gene_type:complete
MKKLQDTKIGQLLKEKAPQVFEVAKNLLPDKGLLGVVKNLVSQSDLSKEDKEQIHKQLVEFYELEVQDRDSARDREVKMAEAGANDWMMNVTGIIGLACFVFIIYSVVYIPAVLENELFIHLMGMVEGVVIGNIFAFYYGTSSKK